MILKIATVLRRIIFKISDLRSLWDIIIFAFQGTYSFYLIDFFFDTSLPLWIINNWNVLFFSITFSKRSWTWVYQVLNLLVFSLSSSHIISPSDLPSLCFKISIFLLRKCLSHCYSVWHILFYFPASTILVQRVGKYLLFKLIQFLLDS